MGWVADPGFPAASGLSLVCRLVCRVGRLLGRLSTADSGIPEGKYDRSCALPGVYTVSCRDSASSRTDWGSGGRRFKSGRPDSVNKWPHNDFRCGASVFPSWSGQGLGQGLPPLAIREGLPTVLPTISRSGRALVPRELPGDLSVPLWGAVENAVYRQKTIIGRGMRSRTLFGQRMEVRLAWRTLNGMTSLGMPDRYRVA